jgi:uncharacterized protein YndB with AHSA1/START domain
MDGETQNALTLTRVFDAPRALVFKLWSEPQHLARWWGPQGWRVATVAMDFRIGGAWKVCLCSDDGLDFWMGGEYREIRAPERLVFSFKWDAAHGKPKLDTVATVILTEEGGKTRLDLHQAPFAARDARAAHQGGWGDTLDRLAAYLAEVEARR